MIVGVQSVQDLANSKSTLRKTQTFKSKTQSLIQKPSRQQSNDFVKIASLKGISPQYTQQNITLKKSREQLPMKPVFENANDLMSKTSKKVFSQSAGLKQRHSISKMQQFPNFNQLRMSKEEDIFNEKTSIFLQGINVKQSENELRAQWEKEGQSQSRNFYCVAGNNEELVIRTLISKG